MPVCNKCNIDKPQDEYFKEKKGEKYYYKKYCNDCFRKQSRDWKARNRVKKKQVIELPQPKEIVEPKVLELQPGYKECYECNQIKPLDKFYCNSYKNPIKKCKTCYNKQYKKSVDENNRERGGSERVPAKPNTYTDIYQKEQVFLVMKAFGWIFDESTGIWNKPGFKENGVFINIIPTGKKKRKSPSNGGGRKLKTGIYNNINEIIRLMEIGHTYSDIGEYYNCSHTMIRRVVSKYRDERRTS